MSANWVSLLDIGRYVPTNREMHLHTQGVRLVSICNVCSNHKGSIFRDNVSSLVLENTHAHSVNVRTMILSIVIKNMINHYIFAKQVGKCYHGDVKRSMLLCISTEMFKLLYSSGWCVELQQTKVGLKRDSLFWDSLCLWDSLSLPRTSVVFCCVQFSMKVLALFSLF